MSKTEFQTLTTKQKYAYTFERASAALINRGYKVMKLTKDPQKAYFVVKHADGSTFCKVVIKNRLYFDKKFIGHGFCFCFTYDGQCYFYDHDEILQKVIQTGVITGTDSWEVKGVYHFPTLSVKLLQILEEYKLPKLR
jgi:predicted GNAT superfamily acetyltransferase